ncbi:hypothetical protein [Planctomyces sp. SH-PL62]|uniref:hypothetical protein n=1 Tax=Planctomyces sp. SH-PL62 TaxID=1636152 RepID=UPI00078E297E|nr:hypothetical protein [Planctomyces sp. SH-PL62]AMV39241.1 hypothetical protein VT85_17520 [Planctomyces sp. SH-PL62]
MQISEGFVTCSHLEEERFSIATAHATGKPMKEVETVRSSIPDLKPSIFIPAGREADRNHTNNDSGSGPA